MRESHRDRRPRSVAAPDSALPEVCSFQLPKVCSFRLPLTDGAKGRRRAVLSVSNWALQEEMRMKAKPFVISKQALRDDRCVRLMGAV